MKLGLVFDIVRSMGWNVTIKAVDHNAVVMVNRPDRSITVNSNSDPVEQMEGVILLAVVGRLGKAPDLDHTVRGEKFHGFQSERVKSVLSAIEHTAAVVNRK